MPEHFPEHYSDVLRLARPEGILPTRIQCRASIRAAGGVDILIESSRAAGSNIPILTRSFFR